MGKNKQNMKPKSGQNPTVDNDQIGENASGYGKQDETYKKNKCKE